MPCFRSPESWRSYTLDMHVPGHRVFCLEASAMSWSLRLHRPTCHTGHPQRLLVLWRLGAVLTALFAPRGPDATEMDLRGLEEGHHEGLLVLGSMPSNQACQLGVDALPCRGGIQCWGQGWAGGTQFYPHLVPRSHTCCPLIQQGLTGAFEELSEKCSGLW